jgi:hypothetical protein
VYFSAGGGELREVIELELEESFVELLRSARTHVVVGVAGEEF